VAGAFVADCVGARLAVAPAVLVGVAVPGVPVVVSLVVVVPGVPVVALLAVTVDGVWVAVPADAAAVCVSHMG
jgi:hypothetical protein